MFATPAFAQTAAAAGQSGGIADILAGPFPLLVGVGLMFYFLMLRPQQKRMKEHQGMVAALKRGDTVVLNSGVIGKVSKVEDAELGVDIATGVTIKVVKSMVSEVRTRGEPVANDAKS